MDRAKALLPLSLYISVYHAPSTPTLERCSMTFSDLPDDCLLMLFGFLEGGQLEDMKCVSRRMNRLANNRMFAQVKRTIREVRVQKNGYGYALLLESENGQSILHQFGSARQVRGIRNYSVLKNSRFGWREEQPPAYDMFILMRSTPSNDFLPIPKRLFKTLEHYMAKCENRMLKIVDMKIDFDTLQELLKISRSSGDFHLVIDGSDFETGPNMYGNWVYLRENEIFEVLCSMPSLTLINSDVIKKADAFFVRRFSRNKFGGVLEMKFNAEDNYEAHRFYPHHSIVDEIVTFKLFNVPLLTLNSDILPDLLDKAFAKAPTSAKWKFALKEPVSQATITNLKARFEMRESHRNQSRIEFQLRCHNHPSTITCDIRSYLTSLYMLEATISTDIY